MFTRILPRIFRRMRRILTRIFARILVRIFTRILARICTRILARILGCLIVHCNDCIFWLIFFVQFMTTCFFSVEQNWTWQLQGSRKTLQQATEADYARYSLAWDSSTRPWPCSHWSPYQKDLPLCTRREGRLSQTPRTTPTRSKSWQDTGVRIRGRTGPRRLRASWSLVGSTLPWTMDHSWSWNALTTMTESSLFRTWLHTSTLITLGQPARQIM